MGAVIPKGFSLLLTTDSRVLIQEETIVDSNVTGKFISKFPLLKEYNETVSDFSTSYDSTLTSGVLVSSKLLKSNSLQKLAIEGLSFKLPNLSNTVDNKFDKSVFLPTGIKSVFLFAISEDIKSIRDKSIDNPVFYIRGTYKVKDYNILFPMSYLQKVKISFNSIDKLVKNNSKNKDLLFYNKKLEFEDPLLISSVVRDMDKDSSGNDNNSNLLTNKLLESIYRNWIQNSDPSINVLESTICFINNGNVNKNENVCFEIEDSLNKIKFFPAFDNENKLNFNQLAKAHGHAINKRDADQLTALRFKKTVPGSIFEDTEGIIESQVGDTELEDNEFKFSNISRCHEEEEIREVVKPLRDTLFQNSSLRGLERRKLGAQGQILGFSKSQSMLVARPRHETYKEVVERDGNSFSFH